MTDGVPPTSDSKVTLREISGDTVRAICRLSVHPDQTGFVADNATSLAQAPRPGRTQRTS